MSDVSPEFLRRRLAEFERGQRELQEVEESNPQENRTGTGDPPGTTGAIAMNECLARLEGAFDSVKIVLTVIVAVMIGGFAFLGVQVTRIDGKVSALSEQVSGLPDKINANMRDLTKTLAEVITASKQMPPQVADPHPGAAAAAPRADRTATITRGAMVTLAYPAPPA